MAMDDVHVTEAAGPSVAEAEIEIVERKGIGHPDTVCDSVMEEASRALCRLYLKTCGTILHHNCDKGMLVAGRVQRRFGGGQVLEPMRMILGDRATTAWNGAPLDVGAAAVRAARDWFHERLPRVNCNEHVVFQPELRPGSDELRGVFREPAGLLGANDTVAAVGYAPLTETERLVLATEQYLNTWPFKGEFPETGEDVKVMGVRRGRYLHLTVAMPIVDRHVESESDYFSLKERVRQNLAEYLRGQTRELKQVALSLNALDRPGTGIGGVYLSVLGTSAEDADSGQVGRGNGVNGLIALNRPHALEAVAGKNPVSHAGKIYNVLAHLLAQEIVGQLPGVHEAAVCLVSRISAPVDHPQVVSVQLRLEHSAALATLADCVEALVRRRQADMAGFCRELAEGKYPVC
jgi:S-adenosylmethionine synthetase